MHSVFTLIIQVALRWLHKVAFELKLPRLKSFTNEVLSDYKCLNSNSYRNSSYHYWANQPTHFLGLPTTTEGSPSFFSQVFNINFVNDLWFLFLYFAIDVWSWLFGSCQHTEEGREHKIKKDDQKQKEG